MNTTMNTTTINNKFFKKLFCLLNFCVFIEYRGISKTKQQQQQKYQNFEF